MVEREEHHAKYQTDMEEWWKARKCGMKAQIRSTIYETGVVEKLLAAKSIISGGMWKKTKDKTS